MSRGVFAWSVVIDPAWPVFIAWSMSSASAPRHSPMMIRFGRIRSALNSRSRIVTRPSPSTFGGRLSSAPTCSCWSCSSAVSSMVMIRSPSGMNADSALSRVVFPLPVPPLTMMFSFARTAA